MKMKDVIYNVAVMLQLDELKEALDEGSESGEGEAGEQLGRVLHCANLAINEIACDYVPLKVRERVSADEKGEVGFSALKFPIVDLFEARNAKGARVPVRFYAGKFAFPRGGEYDIVYSYAPPAAGLGDELPFSERVPARLIALGAATEYCIITGMTDDAVLFDKLYRDGLHAAAVQKTERRLPRRRWL